LLGKVALFLGEGFGNFDVDGYELIATIAAPHIGNALAAKPELLTGLGTRREFERNWNVDGLDLDLVAEHCLRDVDANLKTDRFVLAGEVRMLLDPDFHIEIASWSTLRTRFALTGQTERRALVDSGWDGHVDCASLGDPTSSATARAGIGDLNTLAATGRAWCRGHELSEDRLLNPPNLAGSVTG
jgi:hypothetical protein